MTPRTSSPRARARSASAPASSGAQPQRGRPTLTSIEHLADARRRGGVDVASESTATVTRASRARPSRRRRAGSTRLVGEQQVVAEPGAAMPTHLAWRRAGEAVMARARPGARERGALVRLDVRAQRVPGRAAAIVARLWSSASASIRRPGWAGRARTARSAACHGSTRTSRSTRVVGSSIERRSIGSASRVGRGTPSGGRCPNPVPHRNPSDVSAFQMAAFSTPRR